MNNRLRLLIITDNAILRTGGSERFLRNLLDRLPQNRYQIDVLQLSAAPLETERVAEIDLGSVRLLYFPIEAIYGIRGLAALHFVRRHVVNREYDIVQSQHEKSDLINAFLPRKATVRKISNRRDMGFQKSTRLRALFRRINSRFDHIVAPTSKILDSLVARENVDSSNCSVIANGVDTQRFCPVDVERRARLRAQLGIDANAAVVGCVASFSPVKRHCDLVAAFARVHDQFPNTLLLFVGEGSLRSEIETQVESLQLTSSVRLIAPRGDVENILPTFDIFALASSTEGMSNAILEAQACSLPVVATAVGGNIDLVESGENGLLVPPMSVEAFATALSQLLSHPDQAAIMGLEARARIERKHSLDAMAAAYDNLYCDLAGYAHAT